VGTCAGRRIPAWTIPYHVWKAEICLNFADQPDGKPGMKIRPWEGLACGTCVISESWSSCLDLFSENEILYGDVEVWHTFIRTLLSRKERMHEMAKQGCAGVFSRHTWAQRFRHHVVLWKELL
jgi:spore maturation protein CgeB